MYLNLVPVLLVALILLSPFIWVAWWLIAGLRRVTATHPGHSEATLVLRDGSTVGVRPIRPEDEAELARFSRRFR